MKKIFTVELEFDNEFYAVAAEDLARMIKSDLPMAIDVRVEEE